jgi:hypothetical protein
MVDGENGGDRGVEERKVERGWKGRGKDPRARKGNKAGAGRVERNQEPGNKENKEFD